MKKVTTAIIHETRKNLADGSHPVKLRLTYDRKRKYYTLNTRSDKTGLTESEWQKVETASKGEYKAIRLALQEKEKEAIEIINEMPVFSFEQFETKYFNKSSKTDLFAALQEKHTALVQEERLRTALVYQNALDSLKSFAKRDKLAFTQVTPELLNKYEKWMTKKGNSPTTTSMYLRTARAMFNQAGINGDAYPFGRGKYELPEGRNIKKALSIKDIQLIYKYDAAPGSFRELYRDYWMLSYFCNGANITDLAKLRYKNIDSEVITFTRTKTAHNKRNKAIVVVLTPEIARIIDKYKQPYISPETYLLPILNDKMTAKQQLTAIKNTVRGINKHIKVIAANIGLTANISTYTARHSYATVMKRSGASMEFISESLGHSNIKTTENYLADFEIDKKREMAALLTKWDHE